MAFSSEWGVAAWGSFEFGATGGISPPPGPPAGTPGGEGQMVSGGPAITGAPWRHRVVSPPPSPPAPPVKSGQYFSPAVVGGPLRNAPWFHHPPLEMLPNQAPPPVPPPINPRLPEVQGGPLAFAPWNQRRVIRDQLPNIAPPPPIPQMMPPAITGGPPILGAPWHQLRVNTPAAVVPPVPPVAQFGRDGGQLVTGGPISFAPWSHGGPIPVQPVPGPTPPQPPQPTLVGETPPVPQVPTDDKRLFRFTQIVATMLNALVRRGEIVRAGPSDWSLADIVLSFNGRTGNVTLQISDLPASGVTAGDYIVPDISVDQYGRVTNAMSRTASIGVPLIGAGADQSPAFGTQLVNVDSRAGAIRSCGFTGFTLIGRLR